MNGVAVDHCLLLNEGDRTFIARQSMAQSRSHFGCTLSKHDNKVIVVGGQVSGLVPNTDVLTTQRCEMYDVAANKWTELTGLV